MEQTKKALRRVLVLGGYGLIGSGIMYALTARGHRVTGLGRNAATAARVSPDANWMIRDLRDLQTPTDWTGVLDGFDVVVNAVGALQDGGADDLVAVQEQAIVALASAAAAAGVDLIQISAAGVASDASTSFMATKARADAAIQASPGRWFIFRPGLVIAQTSYGGTALVRMLAAMPVVQPVAMADAPVQSVGLSDVVDAVAMAVEGDLAPGLTCDLVEDHSRPLADVVAAHREWLGLGPARPIAVPNWVLGPISWCADLLGHLGWRSPMRTTAVRVLAEGVRGDPTPWRNATGQGCAALPGILAAIPATAEHRLAARMALLLPVAISILALFWLLSGLIGMISLEQAAATLTAVGWPVGLAKASVLFWTVVDIALAAGVLVRRWAPRACWAMIAVSLFYLIAASVFTPGLWLDPLGPLVKVLPGIVLALVTRALLETR